MRLRVHRALINLAFFTGALCFVLYLNFHQSWHSTDKAFAWTTIRYETDATEKELEGRGVCPGVGDSSKPALVVSRVTEDGDAKWLDALTELYYLCIYTVDAPADQHATYLRTPANRGHEAMAYLTFLIDNYEEIPAAGAVFVHGSRWAWHNDAPDYDNAALLAALNVSAALAPLGYHNLRCDWSASSCAPDYGPPQGSLETSLNARLQPWDQRSVSDAALPGALATLFGGDEAGTGQQESLKTLLGRTDALRAQCCAQFVVSRENIHQHARNEYVALRQWLLDGSSDDTGREKDNVAPADDRIAGRIASYLWHILFLPQELANSQGDESASEKAEDVDLGRLNTLACPRADECYCRLYGRCNLEGCTSPGRCHGQYTIPPDFRLPSNWAAMHS